MEIDKKKSSERSLRHLLVVNDDAGKETYVLEASMYAIGRDVSNAIVIHSEAVSRKHAILLRTPSPDRHGYRYTIKDGSIEGKRSVNGIVINGKPKTLHNLEDGDEIVLGGKVVLHYHTAMLFPHEVEDKVKLLQFQSLKEPIVSTEKTVQVDPIDSTAPFPPVLSATPTSSTKLPTPSTSSSTSSTKPLAFSTSSSVKSATKEQLALFRQCYETVAIDLEDLHLSPEGYAIIAAAIYTALPRSVKDGET